MKNAEYCELIESYCHCPHCATLISNEENYEEEIQTGSVINCPECGKKFKVIS